MKRVLISAVLLALAVSAGLPPLRSQDMRRLGAGLEVLVLDHRGRPTANVPVGMRERDSRFPFLVFPSRSGADGRARVRVPGNVMRSGSPVIVRVGIPLAEPVEQEVDLGAQQAGEVRLQLPPTGQLRVIVYDEKERPRKGLRSVTLMPAVRGRQTGPPQMFSPPVIEEDNAVFPHVGLDMEFEVTVQVEGLTGALRVRGKGPTLPGEMVVLPVRTTTGPSVVSLRILDRGGEPVVDEVLATIVDNGRFFSARETPTDGEGRMRLVMNESLLRDNTVTLTVWRRGEGELTQSRGAARIQVEDNLRPGENDRGDLQLVEEPVVVSGRVVDPAGRPLPGVSVVGSITYDSLQGGSSGGMRDFFRHRVRTDEDGSFAIRELGVDPAELRLELTKEGYHRAWEGVPPGSLDLRFVLDRAAGLEGSFAELPEAWNMAGRPFPYLVRADGGAIGPGIPNLEAVTSDSAFRFEDVAPGDYELEIRLDDDAEAVLTVPGLRLEAGEVLRDPRLQEIEWKSYCRFVTLTILSPDEQPLSNVTVWTHYPKGNGWHGSGGSTDADGVVQLFVPARDARVSIDAQEYSIQRLSGVVTDQRVILQRRPVVEVRLQGELPELGDVVMSARLSEGSARPAEESWGMKSGGGGTAVVDRGVATLKAWSEGAYDLDIRLERRRVGGYSITTVMRKQVEVRAGVQTVTVEVDDEFLVRILSAIERLRR